LTLCIPPQANYQPLVESDTVSYSRRKSAGVATRGFNFFLGHQRSIARQSSPLGGASPKRIAPGFNRTLPSSVAAFDVPSANDDRKDEHDYPQDFCQIDSLFDRDNALNAEADWLRPSNTSESV
jgi:hypothetical protein